MFLCPECEGITYAVDGWDLANGGGRRRRRECSYCGHSIYTLEVVENREPDPPPVEQPKIEKRETHAEKTFSYKPTVQRAVSRKESRGPYSVSQLRIALRPRERMAQTAGASASEGTS